MEASGIEPVSVAPSTDHPDSITDVAAGRNPQTTTTASKPDIPAGSFAEPEKPEDRVIVNSDSASKCEKEKDGSANNDNKRIAELCDVAKKGYFALYGGMGFLTPFWSVLLVTKGFSASWVGALTAVLPLASLVLLPPLSLRADRHRNAPDLAMYSAISASIMTLILCYVSDPFYAGVAAVASFVLQTPLPPFFDDHTMNFLPTERRTEWGNLRVFGAYSWGITAPLSSYLFGNYGWLTSGVCFGLGICTTAYLMKTSADAVADKPPSEKKYKEVIQFIRKNQKVFAFVVGAASMGMGYILIQTFLFIYLQDELDAPDLLLGISVTLTVAVEIPFMAFSSKLHTLLTDTQMFTAAALGWSVRVLGYSLLWNPWHVLLLEPLHGFSFALLWLSCVHYFKLSFPEDLSATAFGVLHASVFGFGPLLGNLVGGYLYDTVGPRSMYRIMAFWMVIMVCVFWYLFKTAPPSDDVAEEDRQQQAAGRNQKSYGKPDDATDELATTNRETPAAGNPPSNKDMDGVTRHSPTISSSALLEDSAPPEKSSSSKGHCSIQEDKDPLEGSDSDTDNQ